MELNSKTKLSAVIAAYPFVKEYLIGVNPHFKALDNPVLWNTLGKAATLGQVALAGGIYLGWTWIPVFIVHYEVKQVVRNFGSLAVKNRDDAQLVDGMVAKIRSLDQVVGEGPDGRREARELADSFRNTRTFEILERVYDEESFRRAISSGRAKVGVRIPPDYTERLIRGEQVQVQVLIDGSDSQVATTALNATNLLGIAKSKQLALGLAESLPVVPARDPWPSAATGVWRAPSTGKA